MCLFMGQIAAYSVEFGKNELTHYHHATQDSESCSPSRKLAACMIADPPSDPSSPRRGRVLSAAHRAPAGAGANTSSCNLEEKSRVVCRNGRIARDRGIVPQREREFLRMTRGLSAQMAADPVTRIQYFYELNEIWPVEFEPCTSRDCLEHDPDPAGTSLADACSRRWPDSGFGHAIPVDIAPAKR